MLHLTMRSGKTADTKRVFYRKADKNLAQNPGIDPANILITIVENNDIVWSFRNGIAQFDP